MENKGEQVNIRVICVNDAGRPETIPTSKWVKEGEHYTIKHFVILNRQNRKLGVELYEIDLTGCDPYLFFAAERFAPLEQSGEFDTEAILDKILKESVEEFGEITPRETVTTNKHF